ncbi:MAG TPA: DUF1648 domain-containing protein, partial [Terrimesophilobacter sp.]|nr:DUF1648 domain-containing protein [Terrimesophilobacter sp.]
DPSTEDSDRTVDSERVFSAHRRIVLIGGIAPVVIALTTALVALTWLPDLPEPVAIHWGADGADGYGSAWISIVLPLAITLAFAIFAVSASWKIAPDGRLLVGQKFMVVTSLWLGALLSVIIGGSLYIQRGLADATAAPDVGPLMLLGFAVSTVLAAGAWFLLPAVTRVPVSTASAAPLTIVGAARVAWSRTVTMTPVAWWVIGTGVAACLIALAVTIVYGHGWLIALGSLVLILLLVVTTLAWRVSADRRGLVVRSAVGWPRLVIPPTQISEVRAVTVNAVAEFGGWGWRWDGAGRSGVIMRSGDAIEVTRTNGKRFVVTVPDAASGASVLASYFR